MCNLLSSVSEGKTLHKTEGLGNFPTSKNPRRSR
jgi:hypothetical protein